MEPQAPTPEAPQQPEVSPEAGEVVSLEQVEAKPAQQEKAGGKEGANQNSGMPLPAVQDDATAVATPTLPVITDDQPATGSSDAPLIADDVDVMEREWVDKAKSIVDKTKDNPHQQNKQVSALKADYMKKRYGKDIKLMEE